jgi:hypothetical protein
LVRPQDGDILSAPAGASGTTASAEHREGMIIGVFDNVFLRMALKVLLARLCSVSIFLDDSQYGWLLAI